MLKNHLKGFIAAVMATLLISATVAFATPAVLREIYHGISVMLNGRPAEFPEDSQPFVMGDRTYLPLRAMADLLDLPVDFDPAANTAYVGYACISELVVGGIWREVSRGDMLMHIEFYADGTALVFDSNVHAIYPSRFFEEYITWSVIDGAIVFGPLENNPDADAVQVDVFRSVLGDTELMTLITFYEDNRIDEFLLLTRVN